MVLVLELVAQVARNQVLVELEKVDHSVAVEDVGLEVVAATPPQWLLSSPGTTLPMFEIQRTVQP